MTTVETATQVETSDPLETLELMARRADAEAQRIDESELHVGVTTAWREVSLWFAWRMEAQVLQLGAPLEMRVPEDREAEVLRLLSIVNERLWLGHFDLWEGRKGFVYRHAVVLPEGQGVDESQGEILLRAVTDAIDRFYPAFNYVIWGNKTAEEALDAAVFETVGTA
ncbi:MAG: YbjN domain-containing protein [Pseudomonadota bacterium]